MILQSISLAFVDICRRKNFLLRLIDLYTIWKKWSLPKLFFLFFSSIHLQCTRNTFGQGPRIPLLGIFSQLGKIQKTKHAFVKFLTTFLKKVEIRKVIYFRIKEQKNERIKTLTTILVESASRVAKIEE